MLGGRQKLRPDKNQLEEGAPEQQQFRMEQQMEQLHCLIMSNLISNLISSQRSIN